jgi:hypothetical protein
MVWNVFGLGETLMGGGSKAAVSPPAVPEAKEVDYEKNCTMLYRKLEATEWIAVTSFLETGYWPASFFADEKTPADQASTWVTRFDSADRRQLPLQYVHVFCISKVHL